MPRKPSNWKKFNFYLPPKHVEGAKLLARQRGLTTADVVREALRSYVVAELKVERDVPSVDELVDAAQGHN